MEENILYVFDFDDTLAWASDWHEDITLDSYGDVLNPGKSQSMAAALKFIEKAKRHPKLPLNLKGTKHFKGLHLRIESDLSTSKYVLIFLLLDANNEVVTESDLLPYFSKNELSNLLLPSFSPFPRGYLGVMCDDKYYHNPLTVGDGGPNEEMMELYRKYKNNSVVLTARDNLPELKKAIADFLIREGGGLPLKIILKPPGTSGAKFKGEAILDLTRLGFNKILFFDDNPDYIKGVQKAIDEYDKEYGTNLNAVVEITLVNTINKPAELLLKRVPKLMKLANNYDDKGLQKKADRVDQELILLAGVFYEQN